MNAQAKIGKYQLIEALGQESSGTVYRAFDSALTRVVALKVLGYALGEDGERKGLPPDAQTSSFKAHAQAAAQLKHPGIVTIFDYDGENQAGPYIAMEYVEGQSLEYYLKHRRAPCLPDTVYVMYQVLQTLQYTHGQGVVHGNLRPSNVMLTYEGAVKLTGFDLANSEAPQEEEAKDSCGTFAYQAPEQWQGTAVDHRADLWAAGALLYELLTGVPAFAGSFAQLKRQICREEPLACEGLAPRVERAFLPLIVRAFAKVPQARYPCADDFTRALQGAWSAVTARPFPQHLSEPGCEVLLGHKSFIVKEEHSLPAAEVFVEPPTVVEMDPCEDVLVVLPEEDSSTALAYRELDPPADRQGQREPLTITGVVLARPQEEDPPEPARYPARVPFEARGFAPALESPARGGVGELLRPQDVAELERQLTAIVGPVAQVLVQRAAARATNRRELQRLLVDSLHRSGERKEFLLAIGYETTERLLPPPRAGGALVRLGVRRPLTQAVIARGQALLTRHIGPISQVLCGKCAVLAHDEPHFYALLAEKIPDLTERERFLHDATDYT